MRHSGWARVLLCDQTFSRTRRSPSITAGMVGFTANIISNRIRFFKIISKGSLRGDSAKKPEVRGNEVREACPERSLSCPP